MSAAQVAPARVRILVSALLVAVSAMCLVQRVESQAPGSGAVRPWLTTVDRASLLAQQPDVFFAPDSGSNPLTIDVDPSKTYQVMEGFGASFTDSSAWLVYNKLSTTPFDNRRELLMRLFDRTAGIGLSYLRQPIGASDFALAHYSYDDMPAGQTDPNLTRFSIDHDRAYILPLLREALSINPELGIMASSWSAPGWMKSSGSMIGGWLNTGAEGYYANYLVKFIQAYEAAGVPIDRLTPQNEPHYTPPDYPGMRMYASQQAGFIGRHLGPALAAAGLDTRIDAWDHNWDNTTYASSILADPVASPFVAGSAWHCYAGEPTAMTTVHDLYPGREILLTECSGGYWRKTFSDGFAQDMESLIIGAPRNWASTIIKWNIALDTANGPHAGGCATCTGLVTIDQATRTVTSFNYDYYSLGHISKFVLPGARRIASNTFGPSSIQDVAFKNPDGSRVLIVFNADLSASRTFKVREGGRSFSYTLPARGAVTFTWTDTGTGVVNGPDGTTNLALNRPAVASSSESASHPPAHAVDGDARTRWSSAFSGREWLQVDLGSRYALSKLVLNWESAFAVAYQLQVSDDAATWTTVYSTSAGRGGTETVQPTLAATGRYVRLLCTERAYVYGQQWGYSLWGLQVFGVPAASVPPPATRTNLALNKPALASSTQSASFPAASAVDGSASTRWASAFSDPQWLQVDLGSRYTLSQVVMNWESAFAVAYQLQVSDDAITWRSVYSTTAGRGGTETAQLTAPATGRYLRLFCTQRAFVYERQWGYSLWGLQAFGEPTGSTPPPAAPANLVLNKPALASSIESASYPARNAVDGSTSTRWSSAFSDREWLQVDLGSRYTLSRVVMNWELAFAAAYQLQVSDNGTTWTTVHSTSAGRGGTETVQPAIPATARYLRLSCTQRTFVYGQQWGYSLRELQVFGVPAGS